MPELLRKWHSAEVTLRRAHVRVKAQQSAYARLLCLRNEERQHAVNGDLKRIASQLPSVCGAPFGVVDVRATKRPPHVAAGNRRAPIQQFSRDARCGKLRVNVSTSLNDYLKSAFAFHEAREPRPINVCCHARSIAQRRVALNPEYAAMAERRIRGDAPMFAEVAR